MIRLRPASSRDLQSVLEIYNEAVRTTTGTFDIRPQALRTRRAWFRAHGKRHPVLVAEEAGRIVGWASLSPWSHRDGYADTVEVSIYVADGLRGRGIGLALLKADRKSVV